VDSNREDVLGEVAANPAANTVLGRLKALLTGITLGGNSGTDIGDVTVNNAAGASAVNVQDGGNSLTVDGTVTANQGTAGSAKWLIKGEWSPVLTADVTDNDSDKSFTVPASTEWMPESIRVFLTTTADVGNRQIVVLFTTAADVVIASVRAGIVQAASLARYYQFGIGLPDLTAFRDTDHLTTPLPVLTLPAGYKVRVYDSKAIQAAADDMHVQLLVSARSV
jgi:hypothetical protein